MKSVKRKLVVSDAGPLIQLALVNHLHILSQLYNVLIPNKVFQETQYYSDLPDAIEIAKATRSWLKVRSVKNKTEVKRLMEEKLDKGEAEAIVLCKEVRATGLLTSDRYAALKAKHYSIRPMNMADIIREAHDTKIMTASEVTALINKLINQNILDTLYIRQLREEAKEWR